MGTSVCDSNKSFDRINKMKNVHNLHLTIYPFIKFHEKICYRRIHNFSHYKSMEQKLQIDIAAKFIVDEQNNKTCIISTF